MKDKQTVFGNAFTDYFKEVIYGGVDGIVTTFAVVAGFAGAALSSDATTQLSFLVVLLFGLANLFADAASMGLGNFLSVRSEKDVYNMTRARKLQQIKHAPESVSTTTLQLIEGQGLAPHDAQALLDVCQRNEEYWLDFVMQYDEGTADPRGENEMLTGLVTFVSFMIFGAIPLLPFMLQESGDPATAFMYSCLGTFAALVTLGLLKWRVIGAKFWMSLTEVVLVGGTAAVLAYFVGTFFAL
jgi:VIT1/CCC1 family predicted Fe2+/Mn2+ transporter